MNYDLIVSEVRRSKVPLEERDDFVQDVCVKILERKLEYVTRGYVRRLIRNMLIDRARKESRRPLLVFNNVDYGYDPEDGNG